MGVHMTALRTADPGRPNTGSLRSTSGVPVAACPLPLQGRKPQRTQRLGKDITVRIQPPIPRTYIPLSDVRLRVGTESCRSHLKFPSSGPARPKR